MRKFNSSAQFHLHKSRQLCWLLLLVHSLAVGASMANDLAVVYKLLILIAIIASLWCNLRRYGKQFQPYTLHYQSESGWFIGIKNQELQSLAILPSTVITTWVMVLHCRLTSGESFNLLIFNDSLSKKDYRRLLVMLKIT